MRIREPLFLVVILALLGLSGCGGSCEGVDYSFAQDAVGEADPQAAVDAWLKTSDEGQPESGWTEASN